MRGRRLIAGGSLALALSALTLAVVVGPPASTSAASLPSTAHAARAASVRALRAELHSVRHTMVVTARTVALVPPLVVRSYQQALINGDRARAGLRPLTWNGCLAAVAASNARRMAAQGYMSHTNGAWLDLDCRLGAQGGENVGWWSGGVDDAQLTSMFMASWDHRANILGPYRYVATAWAVGANGYAYVAVEFT